MGILNCLTISVWYIEYFNIQIHMVGNKSCEVNIIRKPFPNAYIGQLMKQNPSVIWNEFLKILYTPWIYLKMAWFFKIGLFIWILQ
jgi:hypothetical protein